MAAYNNAIEGYLLHHLPINLRRFIKKCVSLEQNTKNEKVPKGLKYQGLKYQGLKAYERI